MATTLLRTRLLNSPVHQGNDVSSPKSSFDSSAKSKKSMQSVMRSQNKSRALGHLEAFSNCRHAMRFYCCVMVSGVYIHGPSQNGLPKNLLYAALRKVIETHSNLSTVLVGEDTDRPTFEIVDQVNLDNHVINLPRPKSEREQLDLHQQYLGQEIPNKSSIPPWRILVSPRIRDSEVLFQDGTEIVFYNHHSIGDGITGKIFLTSLLDALNELDQQFGGIEVFSDESQITRLSKGPALWNNIVDVSPQMSVHKSIESVLKLPQSVVHIAKVVVQEFGLLRRRGFWTGVPIPNNENFTQFPETNVERVKVSSQKMVELLHACRRQKTTITCLMTSLALFAINENLPESVDGRPVSRLQATIPFNLRPFLKGDENSGVTENTMGDYAASIEVPFERTELCRSGNDFSDSTSTSSGTLQESSAPIWDASVRFKAKLDKRVAKGNKDINVGLIKYAGNLRSFFKQKVGQLPGNTIEVSSLCVNPPAHYKTPDGGHSRQVSTTTHSTMSNGPAWNLTDLVFNQSASSEGSPITMSTISYKGGDLMVSFSWIAKVVPNERMHKIIRSFENLVQDVWVEAVQDRVVKENIV